MCSGEGDFVIFTRKIHDPKGEGLVVSCDSLKPMSLIIGAGSYGDSIITEEIELDFPVLDVERNVVITLSDNETEPVHLLIGRNHSEPPNVISEAIIVLANFYIPANCTDLTQLQIFTRTFCVSKDDETSFDEGGKPIWEQVS